MCWWWVQSFDVSPDVRADLKFSEMRGGVLRYQMQWWHVCVHVDGEGHGLLTGVEEVVLRLFLGWEGMCSLEVSFEVIRRVALFRRYPVVSS